jgi:hypothetical protein
VRRKKPFQGKKMKELIYKRKFSKSFGNKAAVITVPRAIAQLWDQFESVELIFDGNCLIIKPVAGDSV